MTYSYPADGNTISGDFHADNMSLDYQRIVRKIFKDDELFILFYMDAALIVDPTQDSQIVKLVDAEYPWKDVKEFLYGKSNIYFCPSDKQIGKAIEYMNCPIDTAMLMSDKFGMYRLSSPEELFKNRGDSFRQSNHKAIVFGGLQYDNALEGGDNLLAFRGIELSREQGLQYTPLKSSYFEAIYVDSVMRKNGMEVALLTGENGSESAFYHIPGKNIDILHIASHAYYAPEIDNRASRSLPEWMLSHTGLVLSGANNGCNFTKEDGHLTAYEISQTDLSSVKLAVLYGCETGQGDIHENDVYGLLKGMKLAGAGTVMVSLSKVYDSATSILMNRFYDNIFRGDNPRRALENSQRFLRLYDKGQYNAPKYWARFILVDDLDRNIGKQLSEHERNYFINDVIDMKELYVMESFSQNQINPKNRINDDEIYIRLFSCIQDGLNQYVASICYNKEENNKIIRLFKPEPLIKEKAETLQQKSEEEILGGLLNHISIEQMDSLLWFPLNESIKDKHVIYIQASGILRQYPFELTPSIKDKYICRVSSDNFFDARQTKTHFQKEIALFGGIYYDQTSRDNINIDKDKELLTRSALNGLLYLPGTEKEIERIVDCLDKHGWLCHMYNKDFGTEGAFRYLEQSKVGTIHIATHAVSFENRIEDMKVFNLLPEKWHSLKDYLLGFGILCFSGSNNIIKGKESRLSEGDGIVSGSDIYKMKLNSVDFVVLSTCSVLQKYSYNDNYWDIIKAFKLSGVKSIMYSLWKVDDEATSALLSYFYKYWADGHTKFESLEMAKLYVRSFEKWKDPRYWASFVLLDSIE